MRIISGTHKGKRLIAPKNLPVRPTTDMAKESLFNILNNHYYLPDLLVIDLFSGTGNLGYEFASRGAQNITCVDSNTNCVRFIEKTKTELDFPITAIKSDVFQFLERTKIPVDVIIADPPYDMALEDFIKIEELVFSNKLLHATGVLIIEHSKYSDLSHLPHFTEARRYGSSMFSFFFNETETE